MRAKLSALTQRVRSIASVMFDVRVVGMVVFVAVALMITRSGVHVIELNYKLQQDIARQQRQNEIEKLKNQNIALQNTYLESSEYLELEARKTLGLAAPGETVWVVSKEVALKHTAPALKPTSQESPEKPPNNFTAWMDFLFHRK